MSGANEQYTAQQQAVIDGFAAEANNVIDIQNGWMEALLACEIPDKTYEDCAACSKPRCVYAWGRLQTLWPEIGNWPPQPIQEESE